MARAQRERPYAPSLTEEGWGREEHIEEAEVTLPPQAAPQAELAVHAQATAPLTSQQAKASKVELDKMRSSLAAWLKYRRINDQIAAGKGPLPPLLKRPGAKRSGAAAFAQRMREQRATAEGRLAQRLHQLLSEVFDPASLPSPDVAKNPDAAAQLAEIAIAGKLPGERATAADGLGFLFFWPVIVVAGVIAFVITTKIRSDADVAMEREKYECIKQGACTDTGFWLKVAAVGGVGYLAYTQLVKKKRGRR